MVCVYVCVIMEQSTELAEKMWVEMIVYNSFVSVPRQTLILQSVLVLSRHQTVGVSSILNLI